jgi:putative restriction endonuclease
MPTADEWLQRLAKLRQHGAGHNPAPHKPLLLLAILEAAEQSGPVASRLELTPELAFRFCSYWPVVAHRRKQGPEVRYPFYRLSSDGLWSPLDRDGKPTAEWQRVRYADLAPELVPCLNNAEWRDRARRLLIARYFEPAERHALYGLFDMPVPPDDQIARDAEYAEGESAGKRGRDARFRVQVVAAYRYTCALTGYRVSFIGGSLVDAAHIHRFADSRNNELRNGLALCPNAHWLFDHGLWTLADDFTVLVAEREFEEAGPPAMLLCQFKGRKIGLPERPEEWPHRAHLTWHREQCFLGG